MRIKRGDIIIANFEPIRGSEQGGVRPALILQNDIGNRTSPVIIVAAITSKKFSKEFPTNLFLSKKDSKLPIDSTIIMNQLRTIDKSRIIKKVSSLNYSLMKQINSALKFSLGIED